MKYEPISNKQGQQLSQLVFTFSYSPVLGYFIDAYEVNVTNTGLFQYDFKRLKSFELNDTFPEIPAFARQIISLIEEYDDKVLIKKFSKEKKAPKDYFKELEKDFIEKHIRPYIDARLKKITDILLENNYPLHRHGDMHARIEEEPFFVLNGWGNPVFYFEKEELESRYSLKVFYNDKAINLQSEGTVILANNPCILVHNHAIIRFENISPEENFNGQKIKPFLEKQHISIPKRTEKDYFIKFIQKVVKNFPVNATGFDLKEVHELPVPIIKLEKDWQNDYIFVLGFEYQGQTRFLANDPKPNRVKLQITDNDYCFVKVIRNIPAEKIIIDQILSIGLINKSGSAYIPAIEVPDEKNGELDKRIISLEWIIEHYEDLLNQGIKIEQSLESLIRFERPSLQLAMVSQPDWFDIKAVIRIGDFSIPFLALKRHILNNIREYKLPDDSVFIIPTEWFSKYDNLLLFSKPTGEDTIQVGKLHYSILEKIDESSEKQFEGFISKIKNPENFNNQAPESLIKIMRPYQNQGFQWLSLLHENKFGGCLADDMGLGKTLQTLAILVAQKEKSIKDSISNTQENTYHTTCGQLDLFSEAKVEIPLSIQTSLIVAPTSLIFNWQNEILKFAPQLKFYIFHGKQRKINPHNFKHYDLVITTYGTLRSEVDTLSSFLFHYLTLDESQLIKNPDSIGFHAAKQIQAKHKLALTGTPIENSLSDLWSLFNIINPELLGGYSFFKEKFLVPIERQNSSYHIEKLNTLISPFILRRTKSQVAKDLPELSIQTQFCEMTEAQRSLYEEKKSELRNFIIDNTEGKAPNNTIYQHVFKALTQLRLIASHPSMYAQNAEFESGKFMDVVMNMENLYKEGHKVIIFSNFVKHLKLFANFLDDYSLKYSWLTGSVKPEDRLKQINQFQNDPETKFFLISIKAGGTGINLTEADYVFILDPWFNPAVENQAIARAHRIGQKKNVMAYKYITLDTVEEKILKLQERKSLLAGVLISESQFFKSLSMDEIKELLE